MKILLLPERLDNWSSHNRCKQLARLLPHEVTIKSGSDFRIADTTTWRDDDTLIREFLQYDIIHFQYSSYVGCFRSVLEKLLKMEKRPRIMGAAIGHRWHSGSDDDEKKAHTVETIEVMRLMDHVVALSPELHDRSVACGIAHVTYIPNGVDRAIFLYKKKLVVGHCGPRFERVCGDYKGGDLVAEACKILGFEFTVPGSYGPSRGPQCPGQRAQEKMQEWYEKIDVLCQPSAGEGCSNPIMEALAQNIRVVCTPEALTREYWPYVTLCNRTVENLVERLDTSSLIPTWQNIAEQYRKLYERIH